MKIDELISQPNWNQNKSMHNKPVDFKEWLKEEKPHTGDEYYWQHQMQFQQSALHFDKPQSIEPSPHILMTKNQEEAFKASEVQTDLMMQEHLPLNPEHTNENSIVFKNDEGHALTIELQHNLNHPLTLSAAGQNYIIQSAVHKTLQPVNTAINSMTSDTYFKNFHLFLSGEHAELTLNLQQVNTKEQKELIRFIENHLKKKGVSLNRIIINGVNYD